MDKTTLEAARDALIKRKERELGHIIENAGKSGFYTLEDMEGIMTDVAIDEINDLIKQL